MTTPAIVKPRSRLGSWSSFSKRYQPVALPDGDIRREHDDPAIHAAPENLIWTVVDVDGRLIFVPGFATVNYYGRVLCAIPWGATEESNPGYNY